MKIEFEKDAGKVVVAPDPRFPPVSYDPYELNEPEDPKDPNEARGVLEKELE